MCSGFLICAGRVDLVWEKKKNHAIIYGGTVFCFKKRMRFDIITIFPHIFDSYFNESILKRAQEQKLADIRVYNLRDFTEDKHKQVDDKPYGGGAGMVLMAEPILKAVDAAAHVSEVTPPKQLTANNKKKQTKIVVLSAKGKQYTQKIAQQWSKKYGQIIFITGRYEGIDERVKIALAKSQKPKTTNVSVDEISIGPYVLTDGDVAAMVVISSLVRLIPGAIKWESLEEESHWNLFLKKEEKDIAAGRGLEYPHYTRPEVLEYRGKKLRVPKALLSGNHKKIEAWRKKHAK